LFHDHFFHWPLPPPPGGVVCPQGGNSRKKLWKIKLGHLKHWSNAKLSAWSFSNNLDGFRVVYVSPLTSGCVPLKVRGRVQGWEWGITRNYVMWRIKLLRMTSRSNIFPY
jgi:hypothetical protein